MPFVNSSAVSRIEFLAGTLEVWFTDSGGPYSYYGVPERVFQAFLAAPSKGRFFNAFVRDQYG